MKKKIFSLLAASLSLAVWAQTNSTLTNSVPAGSQATNAPDRDLGLHSQEFRFDDTARQIVYFGKVRGTNEQGTLTCERLTFYLPPKTFTNNMPTNVVAETNVIIDFLNKDGTNHIVCDKAIYNHLAGDSDTNYVITFTGHAKMQNHKGWMTGEPLWWNNLTQQFSGSDTETHIFTPPSSGKSTNDDNSSPLDFLKK